jgi:bacteriocin biosynthesis cyclodehydratase domain-containing protein
MDSTVSEMDRFARINALSVGAFGRAVLHFLKSFVPHIEGSDWADIHDLDQDSWPLSDLQVVCAWRPVPKLCAFLDELSHRRSHPLVSVVLEPSVLCLGPVIVPGEGGCWHCWEARAQQHAQFAEERLALLQFYEKDRSAGPIGYLEPFALMGAVQIAHLISSREYLRQNAGFIWRINLYTREVSVGHLIGVHGCPRCGRRDAHSGPNYAEAQNALSFLWANNSR